MLAYQATTPSKSKRWGKMKREVSATVLVNSAHEHQRRRHELRLIYLRIVKRNYGEMNARQQLTNQEQISFALLHCVNYASDYPDEPLREWKCMLRELRPPWRTRTAADWSLKEHVESGAISAPLRVFLKTIVGRNHMQHAALMIICYISAHEAAIKELERIFGVAQGHYEYEVLQVN